MSELLSIQVAIVAQDFTVVKTYFAAMTPMNLLMHVRLFLGYEHVT